MKATLNLENDHIHILRLTDVMELLSVQSTPLVEPVAEVVDLIRNFADGMHHAKEEKMLFPLMTEKGFSVSQGPVAVMLNDHVQGREFVRQISDGLDRYRKGDSNAWIQVQSGMRGYIDLLRSHIAKENNILFRMADNVMEPKEDLHLSLEFSQLDQGNGGPSSMDYIARIDALYARFSS